MKRVALFLACFVATVLAHAEGLVIVANLQVPVNSITLEELTLIYLVQKNSWPNGMPVVPVNREAASTSRAYFSEQVFNRSPSEMSEYWNRMLFKGKVPPLVQTSEAAMLGFVRSVPGAVGYMDADHEPSGVKVLLRLQ
jgi:ABC-type phosphate transport system substrate-binding protein